MRDLNYAKYFSEGESLVSVLEDYNSHNTTRLDVAGMLDLLVRLDVVQQVLRGERVEI
jgi:UDP-glucose 4-epimerase